MADQSVLDCERGRMVVLLERVARLVESGCRCRECGRIVEGGLAPLDCDGRCSLEGLSNQEIADAIRVLARES